VERANVVKEELTEHDTRFLAVYVEAANSCLVLLSENQDKLGTLAIAVPNVKDPTRPVNSSVLVGDKHMISARMFAEYVAAKKNKIAMVSVYLEKLGELEAQAFFKRLIEKVLQTEKKREAESQKT
jgi:hypothetical protein